jgi:predicted PurR-regulated permease PerM
MMPDTNNDSDKLAAPVIWNGTGVSTRQVARIVFVVTLGLLGLWMLSGLLPALLWAVVLAISTWPLRDRVTREIGATGAAASLTALTAVIFIVPLIIVAIQGAREAVLIVQTIRELRQNGLGAPVWISELPMIGTYAAAWWQQNLSDPETARELLGRAGSAELLVWTRAVGSQFASRLATLAFTLLALFFLYRDGPTILQQGFRIGERLFGPSAKPLAENAGAAIGATVNGLVFVGLGEGALMGVVYVLVGLSHPLGFALATAVLATIPFGAPVIFVVAALVLTANSQFIAAIVVLAIGTAVILIADHFIRPVLIGNATRLPFLLVLLGIFGGLERFGLIGLFVGPAIMSVLFAVWRASAEQPSGQCSSRPIEVQTG